MVNWFVQFRAYCGVALETFKLRNSELHWITIDVDADNRTLVTRDHLDDATLVMRSHVDGVTFTEDPGTRRLRTTDGRCIPTGKGTNTKIWQP